ncbi:uncharacterized protein LOC130810527 [Amaranthus tricolor]|uniref:uncharacterized protein LOC130810527 n=1 Tax=Amaranthus tricolor TaxID=29722 RepID=UPI002586D32B|nr:uncharacterized protein LOC130810527 [Amaranthus tricolor]
MNSQLFKGSNVFMSRNLVPPEVFDSLLDALNRNGANVVQCCDPSRNSTEDFHVIGSSNHEKFEDLRAKGCNLLGPQCVLSCAKQKRALPKLGFVCCLAMDSVKVLTSGFRKEEKEKIEKMVIAMSGSFLNNASSDVSFVIVKNVMAGKYKWAVSKEKHIVTINWLNQCWVEHRLVPMESYRVPPFLGLVICVSRISGDERKVMEKLIIQNGGKYSAELTKLCTHLICEIPEGDKFKVANRWGDIYIVTRKWFDQSIARRVCLNEEAYKVKNCPVSALKNKLKAKSSKEKCSIKSLSVLQSAATESSLQPGPSRGTTDSDVDVAHSQNISSACRTAEEEEAGQPDLSVQDKNVEECVADDSEGDGNDLYLSGCRIGLVGFKASDTQKLVGIIRQGGGSRYMSCSERLTHIIVGEPSDVEKRELRGLAAHGVIHVVKRNWLEDCYRVRKEVPVMQKHIAFDILLCKDLMGLSSKAPSLDASRTKHGESSNILSSAPMAPTLQTVSLGTEIPVDRSGADISDVTQNSSHSMKGTKTSSQSNKPCILFSNPMPPTLPTASSGTEIPVERSGDDILDVTQNSSHSVKGTKTSAQSNKPSVNAKDPSQKKNQYCDKLQNRMSTEVFIGKHFCFSHSFPDDQRGEVVQWIKEGGGVLIDDHIVMNVDFTIECHGKIAKPNATMRTTYVSSHWIRSCLEDGRLLDADSHILYSPLPCRVPLPGFEGLRFCVSQYTDKERSLLRNLCHVLGAVCKEKLTKRITHLLCKYATGNKYEAACKWGIHPVRCEWLYECVRKCDIVSLSDFHPEEPESGVCITTQNTTQASRLISMENSSQFSSQCQDLRKTNTFGIDTKGNGHDVPDVPVSVKHCSSQFLNRSQDSKKTFTMQYKRPRLLESMNGSNQDAQVRKISAVELQDDAKENGPVVPDVAAAIEDLLEHTSMIQDIISPVSTECENSSILVKDHSVSHSALGPSIHWFSSLGKDPQTPSKDQSIGIHDGFSEPQTESQMVGYEEDLTGRQMIIDRVRTRSSMF